MRRLRSKIIDGEIKVRALLGLAPETPLSLVPSFEQRGFPETDAEFAVSESHPTLARLRAEYDTAEQTLRREIRKQYPDLTLGPQYESDEGQSRVGFMGAIPLPILNANRQGIAEATAARDVARATFEAAHERLLGTMVSVQQRTHSLRTQREYLTTEIAPLIDRQLADAKELLGLGEGSGLVLLESLVRAHATKMQLVDVRLEELLSIAELEYLAGPLVPLSPRDAPEPAANTPEEAQP